ncbi:GlsB/YeaQ/YmgE family stress response membrane protein [Actinoplanes xinjiangensis]|jgi:uncharacterized membrane protein YeaQ/YmgE (transglycosylase-associated protein family)|uniref:Membrane protein YeaQ/YmgE (Transglycosylase-associated protein family) n=1 Tax=Actinoplanes xinjiangensis TaxID=512350 RepID=A0A316ECX8_9ACTN|nr:GlsB/YeaQ/YmgE family stress response membrane protein [Actinoplanes xinjiangensis]PWK28732.1 hypothetical protein BC793_14837 [Actinoplanes xinjiangensis]GIF45145.1 hypothetical protein Axi01nite_94560 [Actinoplanes xinjiangensis]
MTGLSLIAAVSVGAVIGAAGRMLAARCRTVPVWLPLAAGVAAALLATVLTRMAATDGPGPTLVEFVLQVLFAAAGVTLVALTADRPGTPSSGEIR